MLERGVKVDRSMFLGYQVGGRGFLICQSSLLARSDPYQDNENEDDDII